MPEAGSQATGEGRRRSPSRTPGEGRRRSPSGTRVAGTSRRRQAWLRSNYAPSEARVAILVAALALLGTSGTIAATLLATDREVDSQAVLSQQDFVRGQRLAAYGEYITFMNAAVTSGTDLLPFLPVRDDDAVVFNGGTPGGDAIDFEEALQGLGESLGLIEVIGSPEAIEHARLAYAALLSAGHDGSWICRSFVVSPGGSRVSGGGCSAREVRYQPQFGIGLQAANGHYERFKRMARRDLGTG